MTFLIRKSRPTDIVHLQSIEASAAKAFKSIDKLRWLADSDGMTIDMHQHALDQGLSWVAVESSSQLPIGFLTARSIEDDFFIEEVSVSEPHQKKGVGTKLIENTLEEAKLLGKLAATLTTFREVPWNAPYYNKLGFITLELDVLPIYLKNILEAEEKAGLPINLRCAMRRAL